MIKHSLTCALLAASCLASAAPVVDQLSPLPQTGLQIFYRFSEVEPVTYAQSFRPSQANISGAGVSYANNIDGVTITIGLYDKLPTEGGTLLASGTTGPRTEAADFLDAFWDPVAVQPFRQYYLLITSNVSGQPPHLDGQFGGLSSRDASCAGAARRYGCSAAKAGVRARLSGRPKDRGR